MCRWSVFSLDRLNRANTLSILLSSSLRPVVLPTRCYGFIHTHENENYWHNCLVTSFLEKRGDERTDGCDRQQVDPDQHCRPVAKLASFELDRQKSRSKGNTLRCGRFESERNVGFSLPDLSSERQSKAIGGSPVTRLNNGRSVGRSPSDYMTAPIA